jgi:hypothetical protein
MYLRHLAARFARGELFDGIAGLRIWRDLLLRMPQLPWTLTPKGPVRFIRAMTA